MNALFEFNIWKQFNDSISDDTNLPDKTNWKRCGAIVQFVQLDLKKAITHVDLPCKQLISD